jgi:hypothetical protein
VLGVLGDGAMGVVYDAFDRERRARVALKTLRLLSGESLLRLKREFRALHAVHHPALLTPDELLELDGHWYLVMERIEGVDFHAWVRPGGVLDEARLRAALAKLADGLVALHGAGLVHRDVKPGNVLITAEGDLRLIDFGLVATPHSGELSSANVVGTPGYMSPEQAASAPLGPAADWYSVGVVLYEALTGELPFQGAAVEVLMRKQKEDAPAPSLRTKVAADLDELCKDLLQRRPELRPRGEDVLRRLGSDPSVSRRVAASLATGLVGRSRELAALETALAEVHPGHPVVAVIRGASGTGKTALLERFTASVRARPDGLVLAGRCHERESARYKAVDGAIDVLASHLSALPQRRAAALLPRGALELAQLFPVLRRVEAMAQLPGTRSPRDPKEVRARAFAALRELLARLAQDHRLVLAIDDLHWADADSRALLAELLRSPSAPGLLVVATQRGDAPVADNTRVVELQPLGKAATRELLAKLALVHAIAVRDEDLLVEETGGHPVLVHEAVRHLALHGAPPLGRLHLEDVLWSRLESLAPAPRTVLELLCTAARPTPKAVLERAAELEHDEFLRAMAELRADSLVLAHGTRPSDLVEPYQERLIAVTLAHQSPDRRRALSERMALAHETQPERDIEALAHHWEHAGDPVKAGVYAAQAAEAAMTALAFDRAAERFADALRLTQASARNRAEPTGPSPTRLALRLGEAHTLAGRASAAADVYVAAAQSETGQARAELRRRAAEALLRSGRIDEGLAVTGAVLADMGMSLPRSQARALSSLIWRRMRIRLRGLAVRERPPERISPEMLHRLDVCWSVAASLALVDYVRATDFQTRHRLLALDAGEPGHAARALAGEATFGASRGASRQAGNEALLARARILAGRSGDPAVKATVVTVGALCAFLEGRFAEALTRATDAEVVLRSECIGVPHELSTVQMVSLWSMVHLGDLGQVTARRAEILVDAERRGDLYARTHLRIGHAHMTWLAADDPERVRSESAQGISHWSRAGFQVQHCFDFWALLQTDLYQDDVAGALRRLETHWSLLAGSLLTKTQLVRVLLHHVRARVWLAHAAKDPSAQRERLAQVAREARRLEAEKAPWAAALAKGLVATAQAIAGAPDAAAQFAAAAAAHETVDLGLGATMFRRAQGLATPGEHGARLVESAEERARALGVASPARMARVFVPDPR